MENGLREVRWRNYVNYVSVINGGIIWLWVWAFFIGQSVFSEGIYQELGNAFLIIIYCSNDVNISYGGDDVNILFLKYCIAIYHNV